MLKKIRKICERISGDGDFKLSNEEFAALVEVGRPNVVTDAMVERALDAPLHRGPATFTLDITKGKSRKQLADDYRRCSRAAARWERIAMALVNAAPESVAKLPPEYRAQIERLIEAYRDDED